MTNKYNSSRKSQKLKHQLAKIYPFIEGSLSLSERKCGTSTCACHRGKKHKVMYFTWKQDQITRSVYVPAAKWNHAKECHKNYKKLKTLIKKLSDIEKRALKA